MSRNNILLANGVEAATTLRGVMRQSEHPPRGDDPREEFAVASMHFGDALALHDAPDSRAFLFTIDAKATRLDKSDGTPLKHETHGTPLFRLPRRRRLDSARNLMGAAHKERSRASFALLTDAEAGRKHQNNDLRLFTWLMRRVDNATPDVRVVCKGLEVSMWEPFDNEHGTLMLAIEPFGITGSIFDTTARRETGIAKQQDLTDGIRRLTARGLLIGTQVQPRKQRIWQAAPWLAGGDIHVRAGLQDHFDNLRASERSVDGFLIEAGIDIGKPMNEPMRIDPADNNVTTDGRMEGNG